MALSFDLSWLLQALDQEVEAFFFRSVALDMGGSGSRLISGVFLGMTRPS